MMKERAEASSSFCCLNQAPRSSLGILLAAVAVCSPALSSPSGRITATIYIGRHFEVRDHDQPTKYVFNGSTRVAEITGSLSSNLRVQRLRLYPGWNLCALAVSGPFPASGAEAISAAYQWNSGTGDYSPTTLGQSLAAGTVLWIKAGTNADVSVLGAYSDPAPQPVQAGGAYFPGAGLEAWSPALPDAASSWAFDASTGQWLNHLAGDLASVSGPPPTLSPGQVFYLQSAAAASLEIPDPTLRIRYYHQDHLGSSSVITDAGGALVEETAFYPFGRPRNEYEPRQIREPYEFTQKECDAETHLNYFETRYCSPVLGRFCSVDSLVRLRASGNDKSARGTLGAPQRLNPYAYTLNDPVRYTDPNGEDVTTPTLGLPTRPAGDKSEDVIVTLPSGIDVTLSEHSADSVWTVQTAWKDYYHKAIDPGASVYASSSDPAYFERKINGPLSKGITLLIADTSANVDREANKIDSLEVNFKILTVYESTAAQYDTQTRFEAGVRGAEILNYMKIVPPPKFRLLEAPENQDQIDYSLEQYDRQLTLYTDKMYQMMERYQGYKPPASKGSP